MSSVTRTLKTANTSGYVEAVPSCGRLVIGLESGEAWVKPCVGLSAAPATPTNAAIPANAGDKTDYVHLVAGALREFDLATGFSRDNEGARYTHVQIWSVEPGFIEILGA